MPEPRDEKAEIDGVRVGDGYDEDGCDCTELCAMGPTCPGGMLARLPSSGCWRSSEIPSPPGQAATHD